MKRIPALSRRMPGGDTSFQEYATATSRLFDTIADTGRAKVVLDSSKHPVRALALARNERLDLRLIHLVRDPRAVAWSFGKSFGWNPRAGLERDMSGAASYRSAVKWMSVNLQCEWVLKRVTSTPAIRIRYEDFVVSPVQTISRLANFLELDLSDVTAPLSRHDELQIEHVVAGNRIRMQRSITVKADDEWARLMPTRDRAVVTSLSFPLMLRYGYR